MPKFSIIIPVYNVEKYLKTCLDSIMNQSYKDYEVIVINDGTKDNSMDIVSNYPVKVITQKNQGLSSARNHGAKKSRGDYIIFLDSDDSWNKDLLLELSKSLDNNPDLIRFQISEVYEGSDNKTDYKETSFKDKTGEEAFSIISHFHFIENAWCYCIKRSFYEKEHFSFKVGTIHEDYGLMPLIIMKAKTVNCIDYLGYNYLQRQGSIMSTNDYQKKLRKVADMYTHYKYLIEEIDKTNLDSKIFKSYAANSLILKICSLDKKEYKEYKKRLKEDRVYDNLLINTIPRKIKKIIIKISPKFYFKKISR